MRVWVTRSEPGASRQAQALRKAGYEVLVRPVLSIEPTGAPAPAVGFDHVIFLSEQAVRHGAKLGYCAGARVLAVGDATAAALAERGVAAVIPAVASSEGLLAEFEGLDLEDARVLIVAGEDGRKALRDALVARGARVAEFLCYRRRPAVEVPLDPSGIDAVLIGSQDGFRAFARLWFDCGGGDVRVIAASERIAALGAELGFVHVQAAGGAATDDWISALKQRRGA
ncbi:MAG TPA: uroporphyrinogen-III synthase [Pseudomonadales bacterium]